MADGSKFDIDIDAQSIGIDASAVELTTLMESMTKFDAVATKFDTAVAAASKRLEEASSAAQLAATALAAGEQRYAELEAAALKASKAYAKALEEGKEGAAQLGESAALAVAQMHAQAAAVDQLRAKSDAAAAAQTKMTSTLKALKGAQANAAAEMKKAKPAIDQTSKALDAVGAGGKITQLKNYASSMMTVGGAAVMAAAAGVAIAAAFVGASYAMLRFAITSRPEAMMRLQAASVRLQYSFQKLFRGLNLNPLLGALERMGALFDDSNTSGKALKKLIETIFQPLIDGIGKAEPYISEFFKGMVHGVLLVVIAALTMRNAIWKAIDPETRKEIKKIVDKIFTLENAFYIGTAAGIALGVVLGVVALAFVGVGISILVAMIPFFLFWGMVYVVVSAIEWLVDSVDNLGKKLLDIASFGLAGALMGGSLMDGIINIVTGRTKNLGEAMKKAAKATQDAFKNEMQIKSPSRVMMRLGAYTAEGIVKGVEAGEGDVADAGSSLGDALSGGASSGSPRGGAPRSGPSRVVHIHQLTIGNSPVARESWDKLRELILSELEGAVLQIGGGEAPAT